MVTLSDQEINNILRSATTIAVVGASRKPWRDSNSIMHFLMEAGYTVFPVNPTYDEISGVKCYASLLYIPAPIDIVNIFRKPEAVMTIVEDFCLLIA
ncbi:MAG: CoA-binding protein [Ignavibacteriales bacterium]|nr:CoA-binding protein [Ignavibacteriales bacterium]